MCRFLCWAGAAVVAIFVAVVSGLPTVLAMFLAVFLFLGLGLVLVTFICSGSDEISAADAPAPMATPKPAAAAQAPAPAPAPAAAPEAATPAPEPSPAPAPSAAPAPAGGAAHWSAAVAADSGKAGAGRGQTGLKPSAALAEEDTVRGDVGSWRYEGDAAPYRAATPPPGPGAGGGYAPTPAADASAAPTPAPSPAADVAEAEPEILSAARGGVADDLKRIKGVGPGLEKTLNGLGFYHFDQIAAWGEAEVAWVDARLKFKGRITRDDWIGQAKELAKG